MKLDFKKLLLILPAIAITSCGYSLSYLVEGNKYNSPVFKENYYTHWDNEFKNAPLAKAVDQNDFIRKFDNIGVIDQKAGEKKYASATDYGADYKMNSVNSIFNYGYQSKLFDGRVICGGYYQLSRIQINPNGFSMAFSKESSELSYIALQFKVTTDPGIACLLVGEEGTPKVHSDHELYHNSDLTLTTSIYYKNSNNVIVKNTYTSLIEQIRTNDGSNYIFYGVDLRGENISRVVGMSYEYSYNDPLVEWNKNHGGPQDLDYCLFLYELFIPYTNWN